MASKQVAIVILNYNGVGFLRSYLHNVVSHSSQADVWVADNASTDGTTDFLRSQHPEVGLIQLDRNYGFCLGYNLALKHVEGYEYVLLLNSDVDVPAGWLQPLLAYMSTHVEVAACQPAIRSAQATERYDYAGAAGGYLDWLGYPYCRGRIFDTIEEDAGQYADPRYVFWASGACMLIRKADFDATGGFDSRFFAHMEEIDLCWRLQRMGRQIAVVPSSVVYHVGGGTLSVFSPRKTFLNHRNNLLMIAKNHKGIAKYVVLFLRLFLDGLAGLSYLPTRGFAHTWAVVRAHFAFYRMSWKVGNNKTNLGSAMLSPSILYQYYLRKKQKFSQLPWAKL